MDDKMKAAFDAWREELYEATGADPSGIMCVVWTLGYLRSQQEPHYFEFWAGTFDRCSKEQYESLPEGNRFKFYTHPVPSDPAATENEVPTEEQIYQWATGWREFDVPEGVSVEERILRGAARLIHDALLHAANRDL